MSMRKTVAALVEHDLVQTSACDRVSSESAAGGGGEEPLGGEHDVEVVAVAAAQVVEVELSVLLERRGLVVVPGLGALAAIVELEVPAADGGEGVAAVVVGHPAVDLGSVPAAPGLR